MTHRTTLPLSYVLLLSYQPAPYTAHNNFLINATTQNEVWTETFMAMSSCMRTAFSRSRRWESGVERAESPGGSRCRLSSSITVVLTAARSDFSEWMYSRSRCSSSFVKSASTELAVELDVLEREKQTHTIYGARRAGTGKTDTYNIRSSTCWNGKNRHIQ